MAALILLILFGAIGLGISKILGSANTVRAESIDQSRAEIRQQFESILRENNFVPTHTYVSRYDGNGISVDANTRRVGLCTYQDGFVHSDIFGAAQIISADIEINGVSAMRRRGPEVAGRAFLGGLVAGEAGAIVGGLSAARYEHRMVSSIILKIRVDDLGNPERQLTLVATLNGRMVPWESAQAMLDIEKNPETWVERLNVLVESEKRKSDVIAMQIGPHDSSPILPQA